MSLPRGDEYNQAVQNPELNFADIELKRSTVERTPLGLPKPYSGGFTTTYKLESSIKKWAVRCFTREIKDLEKRYQSIEKFMNSNSCSFLVDAKYVQNGIKIRGNYYPIIKMDWLEGIPLNLYIDKIHNNKKKVEQLLKEFVRLTDHLKGFGIAHGDLQHGNIMVKEEKLFLIDYDGMYLPNLMNLNVNELGHPNFQHPRRTSNNYNNIIDRFSSLIIYTAIKAISVNPNLWRKYENGDNLLFKGGDFISPQNSLLLKELASYSELKGLANNIATICTLEFKDIPSLNDFITRKISSSTITLPQVTNVRNAYIILDAREKGQLLEHIGERVEIVGRITSRYNGTTHYGAPYIFLNFGRFPNQTFTIILWSEGITALNDRGISIDSLTLQWVSIEGVVSSYQGKPQMTLEGASQIQILGNENKARDKLNYQQVSKPSKIISPPDKSLNEEDFWNNYLKDKPVSPERVPPIPERVPPIIKPKTHSYKPIPVPTSLTLTNSSTLNTHKNTKVKNSRNTTASSSNSTKKNNDDFSFSKILIFGTIGAFIIGSISENGGGAITGFLIGSLIGYLLTE